MLKTDNVEHGCRCLEDGNSAEGTNTTFNNDYMSGETTVRYYNEDVWEELVDAVTFEEALDMLKDRQN